MQKGERKNIEGKAITVPYRGSIQTTLREMKKDLQSAISYADGRNLANLKKLTTSF